MVLPASRIVSVTTTNDYASLYRRFRPQRFSEVLGQDHVTNALRNAVKNGRVGHAYLFSGPRGTGKTSSARILAKALNCTNRIDGEPCCECSSCIAIADGRSMDVIEVDAASNSGVDAIKNLIALAPVGTIGEWKVYILDEVHMLTTAASNALLKTLEEPPSHVIFVLATTDPQKVLPTIASRTQSFEFRLLDSDTLEELVASVLSRAELEVDTDGVGYVVKKGRGSARDTLSFLDQVVALGSIDDTARGIDEIFSAVIEGDAVKVLQGVDLASKKGLEPARIVAELSSIARESFIESLSPSYSKNNLPTRRIVRIIETLGEASTKFRDNLDPRGILEATLIKLALRPSGLEKEVEEFVVAEVNRAINYVIKEYLPQLGERASGSGGASPVGPSSGGPSSGGSSSGGPTRPFDNGQGEQSVPQNTAANIAQVRDNLQNTPIRKPPEPSLSGRLGTVNSSLGSRLQQPPVEQTEIRPAPKVEAPSPAPTPIQSARPYSAGMIRSEWRAIVASLKFPKFELTILEDATVTEAGERLEVASSNSLLKDRIEAKLPELTAEINRRFPSWNGYVALVQLADKSIEEHDDPVYEVVEKLDRRAVQRQILNVFPNASFGAIERP